MTRGTGQTEPTRWPGRVWPFKIESAFHLFDPPAELIPVVLSATVPVALVLVVRIPMLPAAIGLITIRATSF
jgi:hypothetical protein